jgi:IclR family KDG regulon transcriptional repressor
MDKTLLKGLHVLEALLQNPHEASVAAIAMTTGLGRSNAHRTLQTLGHAGYVTKDPQTGHYRLTLKLWELGTLLVSKMTIREIARPELEQLSAETGETVVLCVPDGADIVYVDKIDAKRRIGVFSRIGGRAPGHCTAPGKALLAHAPHQLIDDLPDEFESFTSRTLTTLPALKTELKNIRERGFAINDGEWNEEVYGVAAAVLDHNQQSVAAISIAGPRTRIDNVKRDQFGEMVAHATARLSAQLQGL